MRNSEKRFSKNVMNMVLMESLRLYGPVIKMTRDATKDMKVGNLEIPKGTSIIVPFLKMHSDNAISTPCDSKTAFLKPPLTQMLSSRSQLDQELALPKTFP